METHGILKVDAIRPVRIAQLLIYLKTGVRMCTIETDNKKDGLKLDISIEEASWNEIHYRTKVMPFYTRNSDYERKLGQ